MLQLWCQIPKGCSTTLFLKSFLSLSFMTFLIHQENNCLWLAWHDDPLHELNYIHCKWRCITSIYCSQFIIFVLIWLFTSFFLIVPISDSSVNKYIITRLQAAHCHIEVHTKISINKLVYKMKSANVQTMRVKIRMRIKDPSLIIYNNFVWCFFFFFNRQHLQLFVMMSTSDQTITDV